MSNNPWDLGGDGGNSFAFEHVGDSVTGQIVSLTEQQQTDLQTGEPKTFSNGQPMLMYRVALATQLRDPGNPADDGRRDIYLKGSRKSGCQSSLAAVLDAVRATTGGTALEPNATLTVTYVGDGPQAQRGFNPPKLYSAQYIRPAMQLGAPVAPAPQQYAAPAYQQAPAPQYAPAPAPVQQYAPQPVAAPVQATAPAAPAGPTPEQIAALRAAGVDPASVFPGYTG